MHLFPLQLSLPQRDEEMRNASQKKQKITAEPRRTPRNAKESSPQIELMKGR